MSLLITAIAPDGIVLGADSAVTQVGADGRVRSLTGFDKIVRIKRWPVGISVAGYAQIGPRDRQTWISDWLYEYTENVSQATSFPEFIGGLVETLNQESVEEANSIFHVASWIGGTDPSGEVHTLPQMVEISRNEEGIYQAISHIPADHFQEIIAWRRDPSQPYPLRLVSAGLPRGYAGWIGGAGTQQHSQFIGSPVPVAEITSVAEYVRFLIRSIAELYRVARQPVLVAEPVETLILFPEPKRAISTRY